MTRLPAPALHYDGLSEAEVAERLARARHYEAFVREKISGQWFAALVAVTNTEAFAIQGRFETWNGLLDFLREQNALVEVWAYPDGGLKDARRISALEVAELKRATREQPTFITATYRDAAGGTLHHYRIEFGFTSADIALAAHQGYLRHRGIQSAAHEALAARDAGGKLSPLAQWEALGRAVAEGRLSLAEMPARPESTGDLFVAVEYEVDDLNNFTRARRVYRENEIERRIVRDTEGRDVQVVVLKQAGGASGRQATGFRTRGASDVLEPVPVPILGQDFIELRVNDPGQPDTRLWHVLEFGEPELLKQSALAKFSLINAHLEKQRKAIALKKSNYDLVAEPIFAGLNVGGGLAALGFPIGEAARLGYNATISRWLIPDVPNVKQMRELFALIAAKEKDPQLKTRPGDFLSQDDLKKLQALARNMTEAEVVEHLQRIGNDDLKAMLALARMQRIDAKVVNLLSLIADAGKVSGWTDEAGFQRDVFNSIYFSVTGEISIKNIIAVLVGGQVATPQAGFSLKDLSEGKGPATAWLQFLNFTVDFRAVANTVARLSHRKLADKELKKPFPYAPRMSDVAAYEIRIFGFPLLMFYKRGLLKDDIRAFENDYAYGLLGARIVEHFSTRTDMDAEIRDGRMVPLGFVRVLNGIHWKESNLAVFAHRVPSGKYKGKTTVIIYGLKAYAEHSEYVERELQRFRDFEKALREGGVIEQLVEADGAAPDAAQALEPVLHVGEKAGDEWFSPLLGGLLELRRFWTLRGWGAALTAGDLDQAAAVMESIAAKGIWLEDRDPLVGVDKHNSTFFYRRLVAGRPRVVKVALIPGPHDLERDLRKAEEGARLEAIRRESAAGKSAGVVLINLPRLVNGHYEIGPLWTNQNNQIVGAGLTSGAQAMDHILDLIQQLPVTDRARLKFNNFSSTLVELDVDSDGTKEKVFLTVEFPPGRMQREWTNPMSGERELLIYERGLWRQMATDRLVVELEYDDNNIETRTRTFWNRGTREKPVPGELIEETRVLETWFRDLSRPGLDPDLPLVSKLRLNHITGAAARETYGLFPQPVETVDEQYVTQTKFNPYGVFVSAQVFENGGSEQDFQRPALEKLLRPAKGRQRFELVSMAANPAGVLDGKAQGYKTTVRRADLLKVLTNTTTFDQARAGRQIAGDFADPFDGTRSFPGHSILEYRDDFHFGLVPARTTLRSESGITLCEIVTVNYDPFTRRLVAAETDSSGHTLTNTWDYRWESPIAVESEFRRSTNGFSRDGLSFIGVTTGKASGEPIATFAGQYDPAGRTWRIAGTHWFRAGVTNRTEIETRSGFGRLISTRAGEWFESRPVYDEAGIEQSRRISSKNPAGGAFDVLHRIEDNYQWRAGERTARVQTIVAGQPYDTFQTVNDSEGRTITDGIKQAAGLDLKTVITFDGDTDRAMKAETFQSNQVRVARQFLPEQKQPDGRYLLPVTVTPFWGLVSTQTFLIGDATARPVATAFENGDTARATEWFEATSIAKVSEVIDRSGRVKERFVKRLGGFTEDGMALDLNARFLLNPWGTNGLAETEAVVRGTDIPYFKRTDETKTYFDLTQRLPSPWYAIDPSGGNGLTLTLAGLRKTNVVAVFQTTVTNRGPEALMEMDTVDLRGLYFHKVSRRWLDRAGHVVEERMGRIPSPGGKGYAFEALLQAAAQAATTRAFAYRYDPGWLVEQRVPGTGEPIMVFTNALPPAATPSLAVNQDPAREWATQVEGTQIDPGAAPGPTSYLFRRSHSPRLLARNPHQPEREEVWTAWTTSELRPDGTTLFEVETIYDAQGRISTATASKTASSGQPATKTVYHLPEAAPKDLRFHLLEAGRQTVSLGDWRGEDFSRSDFLYCNIENTNRARLTLTLTDARGKSVAVTNGGSHFKQGSASAWPVGSPNTRWLPDMHIPQHAAALDASGDVAGAGGLIAVSVADLACAGLDVRRLTNASLVVVATNEVAIKTSPLRRLAHNGPVLADLDAHDYSYGTEPHSSRLTTWTKARQDRSWRDVVAGQKLAATVEWNGLPVAAAYARTPYSTDPTVVIVDNSDPDSPRPLYALSHQDGHFLEHYKMLKWGDARIYTVVSGFEVPRLETYRAGVLDDEIAPGVLAYGDEYQVTVEFVKGRTLFGRALATMHNRIAQNGFKFGGEQMPGLAAGPDSPAALLSRFNSLTLHNAGAQAAEINALPLLAESLLSAHDLPWPDAAPPAPLERNIATNELRFVLEKLHLLAPYSATGLIPTALGTAAQKYVDTVKEGDVILLALKLKDYFLARELLDFYYDKSQAGTVPLHESYDAESGTSIKLDLLYERPPHAKWTAESQLAIAEAAFTLGVETSDPKYLTLGKNLLELTLDEFRPSDREQEKPRGITEHRWLSRKRGYGMSLWPEAERYSLRSNARAFLLLRQLSEVMRQFFSGTEYQVWRREISDALEEEELWLRQRILPHVDRTGIVPQGLFQVQDIHQGTTGMAAERWSGAEDWLYFLEAAHRLGFDDQVTQRSLDNLARVHGVTLSNVWGLDWSVALLRPDAISPELTAKFWRVARLIGHQRAADFAGQQLGAMTNAMGWPVAFTPVRPPPLLQTGQGATLHRSTDPPRAWPRSFAIYNEFMEPGWDLSKAATLATRRVVEKFERPRGDLNVFMLIAAGFYLSILAATAFWWRYRALRRKEHAKIEPEPIVPDAVMQRAEERWAKRVLGAQTPAGAAHSRFSNGAVEQNFHMQLRAIHKLVLEWRRQENGWEENDPRLADDETDAWLNGLDEFCAMTGLYMRCVIKAGTKDGFSQRDVLKENEDSNHIWSRLVMYFSEYYWGLLTLVRQFNNFVIPSDKEGVSVQIAPLLNAMGLRQRTEGFDARKLFNFPEDLGAFDLLIIQKPGLTLEKVMSDAAEKLRIPYVHIVRFVEKYKEFKKREDILPIHPYIIEAAKVLPHFLIMGLGALVWYNQDIGDRPIVRYLWEGVISRFGLDAVSLTWALPLLGGLIASVASYFVKLYRFEARMVPRERPDMILDATLTSLFVKKHSVMPQMREGRVWNPAFYEWASWGLRSIGYLGLAINLVLLPTPSFATFLVVKGILAMLCFVEVACVIVPLAAAWFSKFMEDRVSSRPGTWKITRFINKLNITATKPASPLWLAIKYHLSPSVPTGTPWQLAQAVIFYFLHAAAFFVIGGFICQQIFSLWFTDTYLNGSNWKLFFGGLMFWNTMYLLRYGLFLLATGLATALTIFPIKTLVGSGALAYLTLIFFRSPLKLDLSAYPTVTYSIMIAALALVLFEPSFRAWLKRTFPRTARAGRDQAASTEALRRIKAEASATLGVVYMSGDDLSSLKLNAALLMSRWGLLRDKLNSDGMQMLFGMLRRPDDATLENWFQLLYDAEKKAGVTLWHPTQLLLEGGTTRFPLHAGLHIAVASAEQKQQILAAWHVRRWLVTMMSTAGHSQDTAINLVDIALRLAREGLAANTVFYLIQNKYDAGENNRPVQTPYDQGELGQRDKLAALLCALAPGARAHSIQDWTPFGFKAGGLTGMDLVHEESLKLSSVLLLDRNATVHDMEALMQDITQALTDPDIVIIIPGRGTTNTRTPMGQASQMVEEGHRAYLRGLMSLLGGRASEAVGTGWGNLLSVSYGRVQKAMVDAHTPRMPMTTRMKRGSTFAVRAEGLIGFTPHAVGISEDTWAVSQASHNAIALGHRVKYLVSRAMWHKIRETWSHSEWLASFPRWAGGYVQMMNDPIMQRINDFGPASVFAKEVRANSGRVYLTAFFALMNILLMPLAIMLDVTPFVQILIVLWNFGFILNQILTVHGLHSYLESSGFYRIPALLGGMAAGALPLSMPGWQPFAPGLILMGFLVGGFGVGLSRWLYTRVRDMLLFGPQLVLHALGQIVRQSLEFTISGASPEDAKGVNVAFRAWAGPREDRPHEGYPNLINLKTIVWGVGFCSLILNLFALLYLDMLNVLLLLPSLLFTVSTLVGPFILKPKPGGGIGQWAIFPRALAWVAAFGFYTTVSLLMARRGWMEWAGVTLFAGVFVLVLRHGLKYLGYRHKLRRLKRQLVQLIVQSGATLKNPDRFVDRAVEQALGNLAKIEQALGQVSLSPESQQSILRFLKERIVLHLRAPVEGPKQSRLANSRWISEFSRSFVLSLFVLVWFFVVPVPGLFLFTMGDYHVSIGMWPILLGVVGLVAFTLVTAWLARFIEWFDRSGKTETGLGPLSARAFQQFQSRALAPGQLSDQEVSGTYALFTDMQTYVDQRSYEYARGVLGRIENSISQYKTG